MEQNNQPLTPNKVIYLIFVSNTTMVSVLNEVIKCHHQQDNYFVINGNGYYLQWTYENIERMLHLICPQVKVKLFCFLEPHEWYLKPQLVALNKNHGACKLKCFLLDQLNLNLKDGDGKLIAKPNRDSLLIQAHRSEQLSLNNFLRNYKRHPKWYPNANLFWTRIQTIMAQNSNVTDLNGTEQDHAHHVNLVLVEGYDDIKFWIHFTNRHEVGNDYVFLLGGGTYVVNCFKTIVKLFDAIVPQAKIHLFGLFDYDQRGLSYCRFINSCQNLSSQYPIKCYSLKSLNLNLGPQLTSYTIDDLYNLVFDNNRNQKLKSQQYSDLIWKNFTRLLTHGEDNDDENEEDPTEGVAKNHIKS